MAERRAVRQEGGGGSQSLRGGLVGFAKFRVVQLIQAVAAWQWFNFLNDQVPGGKAALSI